MFHRNETNNLFFIPFPLEDEKFTKMRYKSISNTLCRVMNNYIFCIGKVVGGGQELRKALFETTLENINVTIN